MLIRTLLLILIITIIQNLFSPRHLPGFRVKISCHPRAYLSLPLFCCNCDLIFLLSFRFPFITSLSSSQANVCHAYQILKRGGLKDENIIVFMYDDIAFNEENPRPGVIINSPNGSDVYHGVLKVISDFFP